MSVVAIAGAVVLVAAGVGSAIGGGGASTGFLQRRGWEMNSSEQGNAIYREVMAI